MKTIKMTSKRQATFPKEVCDELRLKPGDEIRIERSTFEGKPAFVLVSKQPEELPEWFGVFREYAKGKSHRMADIRRSIAEGRRKEWEERFGRVRPRHNDRHAPPDRRSN